MINSLSGKRILTENRAPDFSRILKKYLVYTKDYAQEDSIIYLPVYMLPFL